MTKVRIIEIDLTEEIQGVINDEITAITQDNAKQIETLHAVQVQAKRVLKERSDKIDKADQKLQDAYLAIEQSTNGVETSEIMAIVQPEISTTSAFMLRMKTKLRQEGNKYAIIREKNKYKFKDWNKES